MTRAIAIIDGHPDPSRERFCHALAGAYAEGAAAAGHHVERITLADMEIAFLRTAKDWADGAPAPQIRAAQEAIGRAGHVVLIYPLWLGAMPALLKAFLEQVFRPGFAIEREHDRLWPGLLTGKSARVIVTMGMPAWFYRWFFRAHSLRSLERNILKLSGIGPVSETLIGGIEASAERRAQWLDAVRALGGEGR